MKRWTVWGAAAISACAAGAYEPVSAVSPADALLDTRTGAVAISATTEGMDTRSHTTAWSSVADLNTRKIVGTMFLLR